MKRSVSEWILLPGDIVCNWLQVEDHDSRMLLRMFINLAVYSKLAVTLAFVISSYIS
ncbi:MAG: hypothetical protein AAF228_04130 [Pseudomonadota bacterium]